MTFSLHLLISQKELDVPSLLMETIILSKEKVLEQLGVLKVE
jgi:hypothetical protein